MDLKKIIYEWLVANLGGAEKGKNRLAVLLVVGSGVWGVMMTLLTILVPLVVIKMVWERFVGSLPFSFVELLLGYVGFWFLRTNPTLSHVGNLVIKFVGLPFFLWAAWVQVLPLFWTARPLMTEEQIWFGYVGIYAVATVLSQVLNPKQVL